MRLEVQPSGDVDDFAADDVLIEIVRTGAARYVLRVGGSTSTVIDVWTTQKNRIQVHPWDDQPAWVTVEVDDESTLVSLRASDCDVHFEQLDRNLYFLGISRGTDEWGLNLEARGYIRARLQPPTRSDH